MRLHDNALYSRTSGTGFLQQEARRTVRQCKGQGAKMLQYYTRCQWQCKDQGLAVQDSAVPVLGINKEAG